MSVQEVDNYLAKLDETKRATLEQLRSVILAVASDAEQGLSYGVPAFRVGGKVVAGFSAAKNHVSYLPHSGSVLVTLAGELEGFGTSKGAIKMPVDTPLPPSLVTELIEARRTEAKV